MKKAFESWKIWTILSTFIFMMTCGLVVFAWYTTVSNTSHFDKWNIDALANADEYWNPILTTWAWNAIIDSLNGLVIPQWAIMAFTGACPQWWTGYDAANGRFLLWAKSNFGGTDWSFTTTLTLNQLPPHSHYIEDTVILEEPKYYWFDNNYYSWYLRDDNNRPWVGWQWNSQLAGNTKPLTIIRKTSSYIDNKGGGPKFGAIKWEDYGNGLSYTQEKVDITNPYIKVRYCVKL